MKKFKILLVISFLCAFSLKAQQYAQYSQYLFNKLLINPAYAGSKGAFSADLLYRTQWVKIEGAPKTFTAAAHGLVKNENHGIGGSILVDAIGNFESVQAVLDYAYRIKTKKGNLSLGIDAGIQTYSTKFDELDAFIDGGDNAYSNLDATTIVPLVGLGVYFQSQKLSVGLSAPYVLNGALAISPSTNVVDMKNHYFGFAEYLIKVKNKFDLKPSVVLKMSHDSPLNFDLNLHGIYNNMLMFGVGYRSENSIIFSAEYFLNSNTKKKKPFQLRIGYAFDLAHNRIRNAAGGTHEVILGFDLYRNQERIKSPRFF